MLSELRRQKFSHIFRIFDFDHDGRLQESDFVALGENIAIFSCLSSGSETERVINQRGKDIWASIQTQLQKPEMEYCTLDEWISYLDLLITNTDERMLNAILYFTVQDILKIYDKNEDSFLSRQEYMCLFVSLRVEIKQAYECFKLLDLNHDDLLSKEELISAIREFLISEDKNAPGNFLFGDFGSYTFTTRQVHAYS